MERKHVCIVGGGVIGLSIALYLRRNGFGVTVVEKSAAQTGCSYVNAGYITPSHIIPLASPGMPLMGLKYMFNGKSPFYLKPRFDAELLRWCRLFVRNSNSRHVEECMPVLREFHEKSKALYRELAMAADRDLGYRETGLLVVCKTQKKLKAESAIGAMAQKQGLKVRSLDRRGIRELEPAVGPEIAGGVLYEDDAIIVPREYMYFMRQLLSSEGVEILPEKEVREISTGDEPRSLITTGGETLAFDLLVVAAGAWSSEILKKMGSRLLIQAGKGYSLEVENPGIRMPAILAEKKVALTPMGNKLRIGGTMELAGIDETITSKRVRAIKAAAEAYYPLIHIGDEVLLSPGQGLRPVSPDGMPYIGRLKQFKNVYLATGHAMMGMSLGPATGLLLAEIMMVKKPFIDTRLFDPDRF